MNNKIYDLPCYDGRKSFYGKAKIIETPDGVKRLQSYNSIIAKIDSDGNYKEYSGYNYDSATSRRHKKSFKMHFDIVA